MVRVKPFVCSPELSHGAKVWIESERPHSLLGDGGHRQARVDCYRRLGIQCLFYLQATDVIRYVANQGSLSSSPAVARSSGIHRSILLTKRRKSSLSSPVNEVRELSRVAAFRVFKSPCTNSPGALGQQDLASGVNPVTSKGFAPSAVKYWLVLSPRLRRSVGGGPRNDIISSRCALGL